jgi:hypothetical protein
MSAGYTGIHVTQRGQLGYTCDYVSWGVLVMSRQWGQLGYTSQLGCTFDYVSWDWSIHVSWGIHVCVNYVG